MQRFITSRLARRAAKATAQASATGVGSVPTASAANSAGASTNAAEISGTLDQLLNHLSEGERLTIGEENVASRLRRLCDMYPESEVPQGLQSWQYDEDTLSLVRLAADCAESVYRHNPRVVIPGLTLSDDDYTAVCDLDASQSGAYRATAIRVHTSSRTLVVAVRGTRKTSPIDWITNSNGEPDDATEFLGGLPNVKAHRGFLYAARSMYSAIVSAVESCETELSRVLLTGHSAGGAVAALLFARLQVIKALGDLPLHCVTFGAPPVIAPKVISQSILSSNADDGSRRSRFLAFAAHGDIVVRADRPYVRKILEIYSTPYLANSPVSSVQFEAAELHNAGQLVLLFDENLNGDGLEIKAVVVEDAIDGLLWGNVKAHSMKWYCEMLARLQ